MGKKLLIGFGIVGLLAIFIMGGAYWYLYPDKDRVWEVIKADPDRVAMTWRQNGEVIVEHNADEMMPLASTMKIIVAIEYAEQATAKTIDPEERIAIADLNKFYVPYTDGGAQQAWLKRMRSKDKIEEGTVSLREVAKGMIQFSSNANTEWLLDRLTLSKVNARLDSLGITDHDDISYLVSALFIGRYSFKDMEGEELATAIRNMTDSEYSDAMQRVHQVLLRDTTYKNDVGDLGMDVQQVWSDRLPASTTTVYNKLMQRMNAREFSPQVQIYLNEMMEWPMQLEGNKTWLDHLGSKGGSTAFVLTKALYSTDKEGNTTELAYFFNNMGILENVRIQTSLNIFELNLLKDEAFREKVKSELSQL